MSSGVALLRRVRSLEKQFSPPREPMQWNIELEEGEEICDELLAQLGPYDQVIIRFYPLGYMTDGHSKSTQSQVMCGWVPGGPRGRMKPLIVRQYGVDTSKV